MTINQLYTGTPTHKSDPFDEVITSLQSRTISFLEACQKVTTVGDLKRLCWMAQDWQTQSQVLGVTRRLFGGNAGWVVIRPFALHFHSHITFNTTVSS